MKPKLPCNSAGDEDNFKQVCSEEMALTPEKLDEIERLAELATPGPWELKDGRTDTIENAQGYPVCTVHWHPNERYSHGTRAAYIAALDPATVRELVRLARIAEFLIGTAKSYSTWTGSEPSPAEFRISWGTRQYLPVFEPLTELNEAAKQWVREQLKEGEDHD